MFFLLFSSQKGMCRLPACSLKLRPQNWHWMVPSFFDWSSILCSYLLKVALPPCAAFNPALNASDSAFHFGIFSLAFFSSIFFSTISPRFINFFWSLDTILCSWVLNYFLFFWNTFLQIASCLSMLSGLNFLPHPSPHSISCDGSYSTISTLFCLFIYLMLFSGYRYSCWYWGWFRWGGFLGGGFLLICSTLFLFDPWLL